MTLLVLAGTSDARHALTALRGGKVRGSLAGVTRAPGDLGVPTRVGGFGGEAGFETYLRAEKIDAVLDMTHPYTRAMPHRSARICAALGVPYLRYLRAPWDRQNGDIWTDITGPQDVDLPQEAVAVIFLATGGLSQDRWTPLKRHTVWARRVDDVGPAPWPKGGYVVGPPGRTRAAEIALLKDKGITHMIAKNSGGPAGYAKIEAARALGIPVYMLARPKGPDAEVTSDLDDAVTWGRAYAL